MSANTLRKRPRHLCLWLSNVGTEQSPCPYLFHDPLEPTLTTISQGELMFIQSLCIHPRNLLLRRVTDRALYQHGRNEPSNRTSPGTASQRTETNAI